MSENESGSPASDPQQESPPISGIAYLERFQRQAVTLASCLLIVVLLIYLADRFAMILQQLLVAVFLVYILLPGHRWLTRHGIPALISFILIITFILFLFFALGLIVSNSFGDLRDKLPEYRTSLLIKMHDLEERFPGLNLSAVEQILSDSPLTPDRNIELIRAALSTLSNIVVQGFIALIYLTFLLAELTGLQRRMQKAIVPENHRYVQDIIRRINEDISRYLVVKTFVSILTGFFTWVAVAVVGVDYPVLWGVIAFLFNFVPYLGSTTAMMLPVLLSLVQFDNLWVAVLVFVLLFIVQNGIAYFLEPWLTGRSLDMSPLVVILALAFWGSLWGIVGMLLAIPLVVVIKTILANIPATRPIATLLSNR